MGHLQARSPTSRRSARQEIATELSLGYAPLRAELHTYGRREDFCSSRLYRRNSIVARGFANHPVKLKKHPAKGWPLTAADRSSRQGRRDHKPGRTVERQWADISQSRPLSPESPLMYEKTTLFEVTRRSTASDLADRFGVESRPLPAGGKVR